MFAKKLVIHININDLQSEFIHHLSTVFQQNKGDILDLNTDAVTCGYDEDISKILSLKYPNGDLMYKIEKKERLEKPKMAKLLRTNTYSNYDHKYKTFNDVEDNDFSPLVSMILDNKKSIHIDGKPMNKISGSKTISICIDSIEQIKNYTGILFNEPTNIR
jgi:hypothetical protein